MFRFSLFAAMLLALIMPMEAHASNEGVLAFSKFSIESNGIGNSGPIAIQGAQSEKGISQLNVKAFDQVYDLDQAMLDSLTGFTANGLQISYEDGYKETGGRTLYLLFTKGFLSGIKNKRFIVINQQGQVRVGDKTDDAQGVVEELGSLFKR